MDGRLVDDPKNDYPLFSQESVERMVQDIFVPLFTFKKHSSLMVGGAPLIIGFIKQVLPEIDTAYSMGESERCVEKVADTDEIVPDEDSRPITEEEAKGLQKLYETKKAT